MALPSTQSVNMKGPVPTKFLQSATSPCCSITSGAFTNPILSSISTNSASRGGSTSLTSTVYLSVAVTDSHDRSGYRVFLSLVRQRAMLYTTSSAVSSRPFIGALSCQRTP